MNISLSAFAPENLVSRDGFSRPVPRQPAHLHTQAESGAYLRDSSRVPRRRPFIYLKPTYAMGSAPSLSGHVIAYPMAFTADSPPEQGQSISRYFRTSAALAGHHGPSNMRLSFPRPLLDEVDM